MKRACIAVICAAVFLGNVPGSGKETGTWEWEAVPRVVAVGDVHGSYDKLVQLLRGTGIIGENLEWVGAHDHLVLVGDFLDRKPRERAIMDLVRRLQDEAETAGGRVHVLLGNHEVLNLLRDLRYVSPATYAHFAEDESEQDRDAARRLYELNGSAAGFEHFYPRGYFARQKALNADGEYGSWLLDRPTVIKVNGVVFVHGGLIEEIAEFGLEGINKRVERELREHLRARDILESRGFINGLMSYREICEEAYTLTRRDSSLLGAAKTLLKSADSLILSADGPLWYRGSSMEDERIERDRFARTLRLLDAERMVVAHSPTQERCITSRFAGRLYRVDHGMAYGNPPQALILQGGQVFVFDLAAESILVPVKGDPQGERQLGCCDNLADREVEQLLSDATVVDSRELGRGSTRPLLLELESNGLNVRGIFKTVEETGPRHPTATLDRYQHEVAAYRISRLLGLDLVPVTVVRKLNGARGSLQVWVEGAVDQVSLETYALQPKDPDKIRQQSLVGRLFDMLIANRDRSPTDVLYLLDQSKLLYIDHSRAFSLDKNVAWSDSLTRAMSDPRLRDALEALDRESLGQSVGDLLTKREIQAILARRDRILQLHATGPREPAKD